MEPEPSVPFVTRKMLRFEHGAEFELTGVIKSTTARLVRITGFTEDRPFTFQIQTGTGFQSADIAFRLPEIPIAVMVSDDSDAATHNSVYVELNLSVEGTAFMHLCKGHLGANQSIGWPDSPAPAPLQNRGEFVLTFTGNPAAGAEVFFTTPATAWMLIKSIRMTLVTDANVADRRVHLILRIANTDILRLPAPAIQTASQTQIYNWGPGLSSIADATGLMQSAALPADIVLQPSSKILTITTNLQAGDNFASTPIYQEQFQAV